MRVVERVMLAEHRPSHMRAHLQRVVEVLGPDPPEQRMVVVRHVSAREHVRGGGLAASVDIDAVRDRQPRRLGQSGVR
jgi:hypothetical protein